MDIQRVRGRCGLSRTDVIVTAAIFGGLLALLLPFLQRAREAERRELCQFRMQKAMSWSQAIWPYLDVGLESEKPGRRSARPALIRHLSPGDQPN